MVSQCGIDAFVHTSGIKIRLELGVDGLRAMTVKPSVQFFQLPGRKRSDCAFNLLHGIQAIGLYCLFYASQFLRKTTFADRRGKTY